MLLAAVVATSATVAATRSRKAKVVALAALISAAVPGDLEVLVTYLSGTLRQRRTGVGWRSVSTFGDPAAEPTLTLAEVDAAFDTMAALSGPGSQATRADALADLVARATADEQRWLREALAGGVRQGASDALVQEGLAAALEIPLSAVRRAAMLAGSTAAIAVAAATGGETALAEVGLEVGRPVLPMLASSAPDVTAGLLKASGGDASTPVALDAKLDGIRIQVHRSGDDVLIATRSLDVITDRLPEVVAVARSLPATSFVLDGEALALGLDGRPRPFQETASRTAMSEGVEVTPYFFDLLHLDGVDLLDLSGARRWEALTGLVPERHLVRRLVTADPASAEAFTAEVLEAGHEGVVIKNLDATWDAGRRGSGWVKVKPVHTLDLVVLAVEWGSGRRNGWLSNIHLGARDPAANGGAGGFVMLGKTFKGLSDETLRWQTERFLALETHRAGHVVHVAPWQVVEIAFDGVQRSSRYPGGVALRFARVVRYRNDKHADEADTISTVQSFL